MEVRLMRLWQRVAVALQQLLLLLLTKARPR
jgi:hypothetical protein